MKIETWDFFTFIGIVVHFLQNTGFKREFLLASKNVAPFAV